MLTLSISAESLAAPSRVPDVRNRMRVLLPIRGEPDGVSVWEKAV